MGKLNGLDIGFIFDTNSCGKLVVIDIVNSRKVLVEFLGTGYRRFADYSHIKNGKVIDRLHRSVCGVGYLGDSSLSPSKNRHKGGSYSTWRGMISRCYGNSVSARRYYKGVVVCDEWHNWSNFHKWHIENYPDDGNLYDLDKDIIGNGKVYSPETCIYATRSDNAREGCKHRFVKYRLVDPSGNLHEGENLQDLSDRYSLTRSSISRVCSGLLKHHKGWKLAPSDK